jgi:hypothetical protein
MASTALSRASVRIAAGLGSAMLLDARLMIQRCDRPARCCVLACSGSARGDGSDCVFCSWMWSEPMYKQRERQGQGPIRCGCGRSMHKGGQASARGFNNNTLGFGAVGATAAAAAVTPRRWLARRSPSLNAQQQSGVGEGSTIPDVTCEICVQGRRERARALARSRRRRRCAQAHSLIKKGTNATPKADPDQQENTGT